MACCMTSYCNRDIPIDMNSAIHQTSNAISVTFVKSKILSFTNCCFVLYRNECHQIVLLHLLYNIIIVTVMMNWLTPQSYVALGDLAVKVIWIICSKRPLNYLDLQSFYHFYRVPWKRKLSRNVWRYQKAPDNQKP